VSRGGKVEGEKQTKRKQEMMPLPTCIHLQCLHIFACKYVYEENLLPFSENDLEAGKQAKFINV